MTGAFVAGRRPRVLPARLTRDRRGVAALEFALVVPILVVAMLGVYCATEYVRADMKLRHAAAMLAKMTAQSTDALTPAILSSYCKAANNAMWPLPIAGLTASFATVVAQPGSSPTAPIYQTVWRSTACGGAPVRQADEDSLARSLSRSYGGVVVRASYAYSPSVPFLIKTTVPIEETVKVLSRDVAPVACPTC